MEEYRPILLNVSYAVALWAVIYISAPMTPTSILEYVILAIASLWLLYSVYLLQKEKRRTSSLFYGCMALMPWAFYGELWYIYNNNQGIDPKVFEANIAHAFFIYNSFKYTFLIGAVLATIKGLYLSIRDFASSRPY